jgi:hypothetical protein
VGTTADMDTVVKRKMPDASKIEVQRVTAIPNCWIHLAALKLHSEVHHTRRNVRLITRNQLGLNLFNLFCRLILLSTLKLTQGPIIIAPHAYCIRITQVNLYFENRL